MKKTVLVGISGGIAAFKTVDLINILKKENINAEVVLTRAASKIIDPKEIRLKTGSRAYADLFEKEINREKILKERKVEHIELAKKADIIVIAPATANIIAKLASGMADDYLTTTVLASICPVIICPSMNVHMWENPATQANIRILLSRGYQIIYPDSGMLACGYEGQGRLAKVELIAKVILDNLRKKDILKGKKVVITSGGTIEPIDSVRFITNRSSGKMGAALAESAYLSGAQVKILRSKKSVKPRFNINEEIFETAEDLERLLEKETLQSAIIIHAAAVSDFKPKNVLKGKISSGKRFTVVFEPREKILDKLKKYNPKVLVVGFKALFDVSDGELIKSAKEILKKSNADFIVANDVGKKNRGFETDTNEVIVVDKQNGVINIPLAGKTEIASKIIEIISKGL